MNSRQVYLGPILLGLGIRTIFLVIALSTGGTAVFYAPDSMGYIVPGRALLHGYYGSTGGPEIVRTPGYSLFVVLTGMWGNHPVLTICAQIVVALLCIALTVRITLRLFGSTEAAEGAGYLYACEPLSVLFTMNLLSESLFVLPLLGMVSFLVDYGCIRKTGRLLLAAICLVAATYIRPIAYFLPIFLAAGIASFPTGGFVSLRLKHAAIFFLCCAVLIGGWQVRNRRIAGYSGFSAISDINLYFYEAAAVKAKTEHRGFLQVQKELGSPPQYIAAYPEQANWTTTERFHYMRTEGRRIILSNLPLYLRVRFIGVAVVGFDPSATELLRLVGAYPQNGGGLLGKTVDLGMVEGLEWVARHRPAVFIVFFLLSGVLLCYYAFALAGAVWGRADRFGFAIIVGCSLYFLLISGGPSAVGRFRHPIMPFICMFGGAGLSAIAQRTGSFKTQVSTENASEET